MFWWRNKKYFDYGLDICIILHSSLNFDPINFQDSNYLHVYTRRVENSVDPDQLASLI